MANLFKVRLNKTSSDFENLFQLAYQDIYALAKKILTSKNEEIKYYIHSPEPWVVLDNNSMTFEVDGYVKICKNDAQKQDHIEYDFGKRSPTDDAFIFAIMSIFYHHIPMTEFYGEVEPYDDSFDDGVLLARLVNPQIRNPFVEELTPTAELQARQRIRDVYFALANIAPRKTREVRFY